MSISRKFATGAVAVASVAAMSAAAAPVNAAPSQAKTSASGSIVIKGAEGRASDTISVRCSNPWKNAVGIPGRWTKITDRTCAVFGYPGFKTGYQWTAERGRPCIKVKGFKNGREKWYNAGCGKTGFIKNVPWGNVAANKAIKVKGAALFKWR
ncbi:hypothetical protein ABZ953_22585 [Streptomyces sp. NPDC046465]|uniref:hypothetical protein n=1 Tax=Streptomyces sp. NPDC046465 TaxID=3155810 RepID=UPI0033C645D9